MEDLNDAILENLNQSGVKDKLLAHARAEIFHATFTNEDANKRQEITNQLRENSIINEIIREYLIFNGLQYTVSVFDAESQRSSKLQTPNKSTFIPDRESVAQYLNASIENMTIKTRDGERIEVEIPLIYGILEALKLRSLGPNKVDDPTPAFEL